MTLEQAQIFFYITIPVCLSIITLTMLIGRIVVYGKANKILNKILSTIEEIEDKVKLFKTIVEELKSKFMDIKFYTEKAEEFSDQINKIKDTFGEKETVKPKKATKKKTKKTKKSSK